MAKSPEDISLTDETPKPLTGLSLVIASIALAMGTFMQVLDLTIANVSIPTIAGNLGVAADQGTWVITSFAVANGISVPLTGWLMGRFGVVKTFVVSIVLFTLASLLCGLAWNLESLVIFRIFQGGSSGSLIPGSMALLLMIFPPNKRSIAMAIWSMTLLTAPICGPILGGYISDNFSWRWIFLINVPLGILCGYLCWQFMKSRETPVVIKKIDIIGFLLLVFWVGSLQILLDTGKNVDWFSSPAIRIEAVCAFVGCLAWIIWEWYEEHPIVDLKLFHSRNFWVGVMIMSIGYAVFFGNNLLMALWLQTNMGYIATWAGIAAAPGAVVAVIMTPFAAKLLNRYDARILAVISLFFFFLSFYIRSFYSPQVDLRGVVIPMFIMGIGMAFFFISLSTISLTQISSVDVPMASGLSNFIRIIAGSFAASLTTTLWDRGASQHQTRLAEAMNSANPVWEQSLAKIGAAGIPAQQGLALMTGQVANQAYTQSTIDFFRVSGWIILALIPLVWLARKSMSDADKPAHTSD